MTLGNNIDRLRRRLGSSVLLTVVAVNVGLWLVLRLIALVLWATQASADAEVAVCRWVSVPSGFDELRIHWYGVLTYMFAQYDLWHLLSNMLWLYFLGWIFLDVSSTRNFLTLYVYGGLAGAALFIAGAHVLPQMSGQCYWLIGSSASVLAIVTATAILLPDYPVNLLFLGIVRLKWIALVAIVVVVASVNGPNSGGQLAHIGGIIIGALYGCLRRYRHVDITQLRILGYGWRRKHPRSQKARPMPAAEQQERADREELDRILDKVRVSGYGGLTPREKKRLFEVSSRIKYPKS